MWTEPLRFALIQCRNLDFDQCGTPLVPYTRPMTSSRERKQSLERYRSSFLAVALVTALLGCESTGAIKSVDEVDASSKVSYGRVEVLSSKTPESWYDDCGFMEHLVCPDAFRLIVLPVGGGEPITHRLEGDGSFFWSLPPGDYTIAEWEWEVWGHDRGVTSGTVAGQFTIPADTSATYLGTIVVALSGSRYAVRLRDEYETATKKLIDKLGDQFTSARRLLVALDDDSDATKGPSICSEGWGITCTERYSGVTPKNPVSITATFPKVKSRSPELRWIGSNDPAVSYDLIIHEALAYSKAGSFRYIHGPRVVYERDLKEPRYKITKELEPGRKYFWTVRLRREDIVSDWSGAQDRSFFFLGFVYGWSASYGVPFNFETPP